MAKNNWDQVTLDPQKAETFSAGQRGAADPVLHYQGNATFPGGGVHWDSGSGASAGNPNNINLDILIDRDFPQLPPGGKDFLKAQLKAQGVDNSSSLSDYKKAWAAVTQQYSTQLAPYSKASQIFGTQTPGQLSPDQSQKLWAAADQYEKPYIDAMKNTSGQMAAYLKQIMPSLPKGYQSLVQAQMQGPGGLLNLPDQVSNLIHQENPAAIANAYSQYYGSGGTTPAATGLNLAALTGQNPQTGTTATSDRNLKANITPVVW